jgi:uncharacterized protein
MLQGENPFPTGSKASNRRIFRFDGGGFRRIAVEFGFAAGSKFDKESSMRKPVLWLALWLLGLASSHAADPLVGGWIGGFERGGSWIFMQAHFSPVTKGYFGMLDMIEFPVNESRPLLVTAQQLDNVGLDGSQAHFETMVETNKYSFDGALTNGLISGTAVVDGNKFPFRLDLMAPIQAARYAGIYEFGPGHCVVLQRSTGVNGLVSLDTQTGQSRMLIPRAPDTFSCGPEVMRAAPVEATIHFTTNDAGQCTAIEWKPAEGATLTGKRGTLHEEEIAFTNGTTALAGTLISPPAGGRHPAVVMVADSGTGPRTDLRSMADFFALNGVAALVYDKRGTGKSKGDWRNSGFDDSAGDTLAAVGLLRGRADINSRGIGLWSLAPGAWVAGLAASRSTNLAFVICLSGSGVTPEDQAIYSIEHRLQMGKFSDADKQEALALFRQNSLCAQTGTNWDEFETAVKMAHEKPWYGRDLSPRDRKNQEQWRLIWNYDPVPALQKVTCPVLALYGELDTQVPAKKAADVWQAALKKGGDRDVTIKILPGAVTGLVDARLGVPGPAFYTLQRDFVLEHVKSAP